MHIEFQNNLQLFKDSLAQREDSNFKYLTCRLDFNMYYQMKMLHDLGEDELNGDDIDDYGDDNDDIG